MVGGVQPPAKAKADFVPMVIDETVPGECTGIIGVSRPPNRPTRPKGCTSLVCSASHMFLTVQEFLNHAQIVILWCADALQ